MSTLTTTSTNSKARAVLAVPSHVEPKRCFVWYANNERGWQPIPGTGCAHYVAHRLGVTSARGMRCDEGHLVRVRELLQVFSEVDASIVAPNDVWANVAKTHTGVVDVVERNGAAITRLVITHASSRLGRVESSDWSYFGNGGKFYRSGSSAAFVEPALQRSRISLLPFGAINGPA